MDVRSNAYERRSLGDVCTLQRGFDLPTKNRNLGEYALVTSSGPTDTHDEAKVPGPGVVTGRSGSIGNVFFIENDFWPLNTTLYVKDFHGNDERYVFYLLQFFDLGKFASGAGVPTLNRNHVHSEPVQVACNLDEQKRIVTVLDQAFAALDRARAHAEANLADARSLFVEIIRERFASDVIEFGSVELRELAEHVTDGDHQPPPKVDAGVPFVTISNIDKISRSIDFSDTFYVSNEYFQRLNDKRRARRGDVLYTVTGSFGIPVLVNEAYGDFCFQRHIGLIRTKSSVDPKWLYYMLLSPQIFEQADKSATGTAQRTVSLKLLRGLRVAKAPQSRQKIAAVELDELWERCKALSSKYAKAMTDIANLRQSLLQKAFSGRL